MTEDNDHSTSSRLRATTIGFRDAGRRDDLRSPEQIGGFFEGLELVEPGLTSITMWRPEAADLGTVKPTDSHGAVGRKS